MSHLKTAQRESECTSYTLFAILVVPVSASESISLTTWSVLRAFSVPSTTPKQLLEGDPELAPREGVEEEVDAEVCIEQDQTRLKDPLVKRKTQHE